MGRAAVGLSSGAARECFAVPARMDSVVARLHGLVKTFRSGSTVNRVFAPSRKRGQRGDR
jgi:hypothetical protein